MEADETEPAAISEQIVDNNDEVDIAPAVVDVATDSSKCTTTDEEFVVTEVCTLDSSNCLTITEEAVVDEVCTLAGSNFDKPEVMAVLELAAEVVSDPNVTEATKVEYVSESNEKPASFVAAEHILASVGPQINQSDVNNQETVCQPATDHIKIVIKKEVVWSDDDELYIVEKDRYSAAVAGTIKAESNVKTEEIDLKDEIVERNFKCSDCHEKFQLECLYHMHMIDHEGIKPLNCRLCNFKCNKRYRMLSHLRRHTGEKKIICKICGDYYYYWQVSEHFQNCPKPKPYNCEECEYSTAKKYRYLRHVRLHTGERPYKCLRCESYFIDTVARRKHYKKHSKEKPHQCHICHKRFKQLVAREKHVIAYCSKKCPKCDYFCVNCKDYYMHIKEFHRFTKLRMNMDRMFREHTKYTMAMELQQQHTVIVEPQLDYYLSEDVKKEVASDALELEQQTMSVKPQLDCYLPYDIISKVASDAVQEEQQPTMVVESQLGYDLPQDIKYEVASDADNLRAVMYLNLG